MSFAKVSARKVSYYIGVIMTLLLACLSHPRGSNAISDGPNPIYRATGPHVVNECRIGDDKFQEKAMLNKVIRVRLPRGEVRKVEVKVSLRIVVLLMSCLSLTTRVILCCEPRVIVLL